MVFLFDMELDVGLEEGGTGEGGANVQVEHFSPCRKGLPLLKREAVLIRQFLGSVRMVMVVITG